MFFKLIDQAVSENSQEVLKRISIKAFGQQSDLLETHDGSEDVLNSLRMNIAELEDVSQRLKFMMREVSYLIRRH